MKRDARTEVTLKDSTEDWAVTYEVMDDCLRIHTKAPLDDNALYHHKLTVSVEEVPRIVELLQTAYEELSSKGIVE